MVVVAGFLGYVGGETANLVSREVRGEGDDERTNTTISHNRKKIAPSTADQEAKILGW